MVEFGRDICMLPSLTESLTLYHLSKDTKKLSMYVYIRTIILPVIFCDSKTWSFVLRKEQILSVEIKVLKIKTNRGTGNSLFGYSLQVQLVVWVSKDDWDDLNAYNMGDFNRWYCTNFFI